MSLVSTCCFCGQSLSPPQPSAPPPAPLGHAVLDALDARLPFIRRGTPGAATCGGPESAVVAPRRTCARVVQALPAIIQSIWEPHTPPCARPDLRPIRIPLLAVMVVEIIAGWVLLSSDGASGRGTAIFLALVAASFYFLARLSPARPLLAAAGGLGLYLMLLVGDALIDPSAAMRGLPWKVLFIASLANAVRCAATLQRSRR